MNINISLFAGRKTIAKQKAALEVARLALLNAASFECGKSYCDHCPVSHIATISRPSLINRETSKLICPLRREYSK